MPTHWRYLCFFVLVTVIVAGDQLLADVPDSSLVDNFLSVQGQSQGEVSPNLTRNVITCFPTDEDGRENCIVIMKGQVNRFYQHTFNSSMEFRLQFTYDNVCDNIFCFS